MFHFQSRKGRKANAMCKRNAHILVKHPFFLSRQKLTSLLKKMQPSNLKGIYDETYNIIETLGLELGTNHLCARTMETPRAKVKKEERRKHQYFLPQSVSIILMFSARFIQWHKQCLEVLFSKPKGRLCYLVFFSFLDSLV